MKNRERVGAKVLSWREFACRPMDKLDHPDRFLISICNKQQGRIHKTKTKPNVLWFMKSNRVWERLLHSFSEQMNKR